MLARPAEFGHEGTVTMAELSISRAYLTSIDHSLVVTRPKMA